MSALKIAIPTRLFGVPLKVAIEQAATSGVQGVVLDLRREFTGEEFSESGVRELKRLISDFELRVASAEFPLRHRLTERDHLDERVAGLLRGIDHAAELGASFLTIPVGRLPKPDSGDDASLFAEVLGDLARRGDHVGVTPVIRPADSDLDQTAAALAAVDFAPVGYELDVAALTMFEQPVEQAVRRFHDRLAAVRVRDAVRRADGTVEEVAVGRGEVDWPAAIASLAEAGYDGWQVVDHHDTGPAAVAEAIRAVTFLHNVAFG